MYAPLPPIDDTGRTPPFTRLLTLFPGTGSMPLLCSLETVEIERCPWRFEALSYVWGKEQSPRPLFCGQSRLPMTINLEHALHCLRLPTLYRILWVDAVCINQSDLQERARQTAYMKLIYQHASLVIAWLGPSTSNTTQAFNLARQLSDLQKDLVHSASTSTPTTLDSRSHSQAHFTKTQANLILFEALAAGDSVTLALNQLLARDYFSRVWCIQEVASSKHCIAKSGVEEMNFFDLLALSAYVWEFKHAAEDSQGLEFNDTTQSFWASILKTRNSSGRAVEGSMGSLLSLLMGIRNFECKDPRDRIFALLGISDEGIQPVLALTQLEGGVETRVLSLLRRGANWLSNNLNSVGPGLNIGRHPALTPSYTKPVEVVYRDFTRFYLRKSPRVLDILYLVQHTGDVFTEDSSWPSWVPKLHEQRDVSVFAPGIYLSGIPSIGHYRYFAELHDSPLYGESRYPNILRLDGYRIDHVEAVSDTIDFRFTNPIPVEGIWSQLFSFPLFPRPTHQYTFNQEALDIAFFTVLMGGMFGQLLMVASESQSMGNSRREGWRMLNQQGQGNLLAWLRIHASAKALSCDELTTGKESVVFPGDASAYTRSVWAYARNRRVYRTQSGLLGLGPRSMQPGDSVTALFGGGLPFVLRQSGGSWKLIGATYLHCDKILQGEEAMRVRSAAGKHRIETFSLI
ncbi:heterokaryon incompatibility protein-domain-containing protein [Aspergillus floccosus]